MVQIAGRGAGRSVVELANSERLKIKLQPRRSIALSLERFDLPLPWLRRGGQNEAAAITRPRCDLNCVSVNLTALSRQVSRKLKAARRRSS